MPSFRELPDRWCSISPCSLSQGQGSGFLLLGFTGDLSSHLKSHTHWQVSAVACSTLHCCAAFCAFSWIPWPHPAGLWCGSQSSVSESAFCLVHLEPSIRSIAILFKKPELLLDPISVQFSLFFWGQDMLGDAREDHKGKQSNATAESLNEGDRQMPVVSGRPLISRQKRHWSMFPYRSSLVLFKHGANVL